MYGVKQVTSSRDMVGKHAMWTGNPNDHRYCFGCIEEFCQQWADLGSADAGSGGTGKKEQYTYHFPSSVLIKHTISHRNSWYDLRKNHPSSLKNPSLNPPEVEHVYPMIFIGTFFILKTSKGACDLPTSHHQRLRCVRFSEGICFQFTFLNECALGATPKLYRCYISRYTSHTLNV